MSIASIAIDNRRLKLQPIAMDCWDPVPIVTEAFGHRLTRTSWRTQPPKPCSTFQKQPYGPIQLKTYECNPSIDGSETVSINGEFVVLNVGGFTLEHKHEIRILDEFPFPGIFRLFFSMFQPLVFDDFLVHSCFQESDDVGVGEFLTKSIFLLGTL